MSASGQGVFTYSHIRLPSVIIQTPTALRTLATIAVEMPTFIYVVSIQVLDTDHGESTRKTAYYSTIGTANEAALKVALARLKETSKKETYRVKKKEWSKMAESPKKLFSTRGRSGYDHWKVRVRRESIQGPDIRTLPEEEEELEGDAEDGEEDEEEYEYEDGEDEDEVTRAEKEFVDEDEEEEERARRLRKRKRARYDLE